MSKGKVCVSGEDDQSDPKKLENKIADLKQKLAEEYEQALERGALDATPSYETYDRLVSRLGPHEASLVLQQVIETVEQRFFTRLLQKRKDSR
jgi:lysozyme family protein